MHSERFESKVPAMKRPQTLDSTAAGTGSQILWHSKIGYRNLVQI